MINAESLAAVHTHTGNLINKKINIDKSYVY